MGKWEIALEVVEEARNTMIFYFFMVEEATQAAGFAAYLLYKAGMRQEAKEIANWVINEILDPALDLLGTVGALIYPMGTAYSVFFNSAKRLMQAYLRLK